MSQKMRTLDTGSLKDTETLRQEGPIKFFSSDIPGVPVRFCSAWFREQVNTRCQSQGQQPHGTKSWPGPLWWGLWPMPAGLPQLLVQLPRSQSQCEDG